MQEREASSTADEEMAVETSFEVKEEETSPVAAYTPPTARANDWNMELCFDMAEEPSWFDGQKRSWEESSRKDPFSHDWVMAVSRMHRRR